MKVNKSLKLDYASVWVVVTALTILALINVNIYQQEQLLVGGDVVIFELAPVDPRSLMQGDYMALNYRIAASLRQTVKEENEDGLFVINIANQGVAQFVGIYQGETLQTDQRLIQYRVRAGQVKLASNAFFFEEGRADEFALSKYGEFRVDPAGKLLLSQMLDKDFNPI
ncbi:membrane protein [Shewanella colwelliana]|uniref:Membrane protein n=1 Tax=Shewanella colwelliana TaxID=23 RepID=A0ABQ4NU68_SHECO|nr:GDYXXLXY domain-containing protein [Shewanella colwelliana]GIU34907.1 membrane protein [Shewanella colwelliana]